jgi:hypothetical protein
MKKKPRILNIKISPEEIKKIGVGIDIQVIVTHANIKFIAKNGQDKIPFVFS